MAYLVNSSRQSRIFFDDVDYSDYFLLFNVSDDSCNENGFVRTRGEVTLGDTPDKDLVKKYRRNVFKRGVVFKIDLKDRSDAWKRHPRGYLYVMGSQYNNADNNYCIKFYIFNKFNK